LHSADGHGSPNQSSPENSFEQALQRSSRRLNVQNGDDGFSVILAVSAPILTGGADHWIESPIVDLTLAQSWQFLLRTASSPRAPSSVS
jgi:hypothetical protein